MKKSLLNNMAKCTKCDNQVIGDDDALCPACSGETFEDFPCGKPENHNNGESEGCAECVVIENNL
jgi:hypothetical protein